MPELMDYKWALASIAALISICNLIFYVTTILNGKTKPHMFTWLIWGLVTITAAAAQLSDGGGTGAYFTLLVAFNCFAIAILAYFKGEKNIVRSDKACLLGCLIALALWPIMKGPLLSVILVTIIDGAGFIPTIRKSYNKPHEENLISFAIYILTFSMSMIALENYSLINLFYPAVITLMTFAMVCMLVVRRKQLGYKIIA